MLVLFTFVAAFFYVRDYFQFHFDFTHKDLCYTCCNTDIILILEYSLENSVHISEFLQKIDLYIMLEVKLLQGTWNYVLQSLSNCNCVLMICYCFCHANLSHNVIQPFPYMRLVYIDSCTLIKRKSMVSLYWNMPNEVPRQVKSIVCVPLSPGI